MDTMRMITMSLREINRLKTIQAVAEGNLKAVSAACQLGLSRRQVDRLADRYRAEGPAGLASKKRGLRHHQLPASAVDLALSIIRDRIAILVQPWHARNCASGMALCLPKKPSASS